MTWGDGWGSGPWGGDLGSTLLLESLGFHRDNVIRAVFSAPIYLSTILDPGDASDVSRYSVQPVAGTFGFEGSAAHALTVVSAAIGEEGDALTGGAFVDASTIPGRVLDLTLDRGAAPAPTEYDVTLRVQSNVGEFFDGTARTVAFRRLIVDASGDAIAPARDFHNPPTLEAALDPLPDPFDARLLATMRVAEDGDYGFDEGVASYKKRVLRRLISRRNGFVHLPGYGIGVVDMAKRLARADLRAQLIADTETQVAREPETEKCRAGLFDKGRGLFILAIVSRMRDGRTVRVERAVQT